MRLGQIGFSFWELFFAFFRKYQYPALIIFSFLLGTCNINTYFQIINQYFVVFGKLWLNRHDFLVLYFCVANLSWRIFTLEEIFAGKMFEVIFICGNLFLRIAGKITKIEKIRSRKNFVSHSNFFCLFIMNYLIWIR